MKKILPAVLVFAALATGAYAQEAGGGAAAPESTEATEHTAQELTWHTDMKAACAQAAQEHKLVFWVQMLGKIDGYT